MTLRASPNRDVLESVAKQLHPILADIVFVGGQVAELLITEPAAIRVRPTIDVDIVAPIASRAAYHRMESTLVKLGFRHDTREDAPICRWIGSQGHVLDLMPVDASVLGFSNPWYARAVESAQSFALADDLVIAIPTAPLFIASKLAAFEGRGQGDLLGSHDLEDVITVVAGRPTLVDEVIDGPGEVRVGIAGYARSLLREPDFFYALEGALPDAVHSPRFGELVRSRFTALSVLGNTSGRE